MLFNFGNPHTPPILHHQPTTASNITSTTSITESFVRNIVPAGCQQYWLKGINHIEITLVIINNTATKSPALSFSHCQFNCDWATGKERRTDDGTMVGFFNIVYFNTDTYLILNL